MTTIERLIGKPEARPRTGGHLPHHDLLFQAFAQEGSVVRTFCEGCGSVMELDRDAAAEQALRAGLNHLPPSFASSYFVTSGCICCAEAFEGAYLRSIA